MAGRGIGAGETVTSGERPGDARGRRAAAFAIGDTGHGTRRILGGECGLLKCGRRRILRILQVEIGDRPGHQPILWRESGPFVLGRLSRHRYRAFNQHVHRGRGEVGSRNRGRTLSDEHAQAQLLLFGTADILELAQPHRYVHAGRGAEHRVGGIGAAFARAGNDIESAVARGVGSQHDRHLGSAGAPVKGRRQN